MSAQDFLVELGTEELPPKALANLGDAFLAGIEKGLQAAGLNYTAKQVYAAPRRLAVLIRQLDVQQPDRSINIDGPPLQAAFNAEGQPTQAALGFALSRAEGSAVLVGVNSAAELSAVVAAASSPPPDLDWDDMAIDDPVALDPRRWVA